MISQISNEKYLVSIGAWTRDFLYYPGIFSFKWAPDPTETKLFQPLLWYHFTLFNLPINMPKTRSLDLKKSLIIKYYIRLYFSLILSSEMQWWLEKVKKKNVLQEQSFRNMSCNKVFQRFKIPYYGELLNWKATKITCNIRFENTV